MGLEDALDWYQHCIGLYDKQSWETTVEQRILQGLSYTPYKASKLKTELIDVDLVRGSTFPKAKPQSGVWLAGLHGILRITFLPIYWRWWMQETKLLGLIATLVVYLSTLASLFILFYHWKDSDVLEKVPWWEVALPAVVLVLLSVIHSQIICTRHGGLPRSALRSQEPRQKPSKKSRFSKRTQTGFDCSGKCWESADEPGRSISQQSSQEEGHNFHTPTRSHSEEFHGKEPKATPWNRSASDGGRRRGPNIVIFSSSGRPVDRTCNQTSNTERTTDSTVPSSDNKSASDSPKAGDGNISDSLPTLEGRDDDSDDGSFGNLDFHTDQSDRVAGLLKNGQTYLENCHESNVRTSGKKGRRDLEDHDPLLRPISHESEGISECGDESGNAENDGIGSDLEDFRGIVHRLPKCKCSMKQTNITGSNGNSAPLNKGCKCIQLDETAGQLGESSEPIRLARRRPTSSPNRHNHHSRHNHMMSMERSNKVCNYNSSCESDDAHPASSLSHSNSSYAKAKHRTDYEWTGITTNSDEVSYSSESDGGWEDHDDLEHPFLRTENLDWQIQGSPAAIISTSAADKVSCRVWDGTEVKKADLSVLDISSAVISKVDGLQHPSHYLHFGIAFAVLIALTPNVYRLNLETIPMFTSSILSFDFDCCLEVIPGHLKEVCKCLLGGNGWAATLIIICTINRLCLASAFFFLLSVAERTFKQRFLYAKHFCYLTSARRARKYDLPHFRLNKVRNIKTWLSVRSCLKKCGPQRSVDVIVSAAFVITFFLVSYLCIELLKENEKSQHNLYNIELFIWCVVIGIYLIRFMTLGAKINKKYSNLSVLITEQINMYLHMEQKPQKKDELMLANNVLKLVSVLLKELESPFKISGMSANPLLYNVTKLVVLSACSGVLSDLLGFKLKLYKIKFRE